MSRRTFKGRGGVYTFPRPVDESNIWRSRRGPHLEYMLDESHYGSGAFWTYSADSPFVVDGVYYRPSDHHLTCQFEPMVSVRETYNYVSEDGNVEIPWDDSKFECIALQEGEEVNELAFVRHSFILLKGQSLPIWVMRLPEPCDCGAC